MALIPWNQLLRWAPQIIMVSRELLQRSQRTPETAEPPADTRADLEARIAALEDNERIQAQLVERMAEQQEQLTRAVISLHLRERILIGALVVIAATLAWVVFR